MACARGELYSLVVTNKTGGNNQEQTANQIQTQQQQQIETAMDTEQQQQQHQTVDSNMTAQQQQQSNDIELALRVAHIKNSNYRFRITDQSKITHLNGFENTLLTTNNNTSTNDNLVASTLPPQIQNTQHQQQQIQLNAEIDALNAASANTIQHNQAQQQQQQAPKALKMYRDVLPQDELPQIPKFERLPTSCPQMEKIISIRRRLYDPTHSYDWTPRLANGNFYAAPVTCFPHAPGYEVWDNLGIDMKVEVENTDCDAMEVVQPGQTPHSFWVATVLNICGYKALMRYEGKFF